MLRWNIVTRIICNTYAEPCFKKSHPNDHKVAKLLPERSDCHSESNDVEHKDILIIMYIFVCFCLWLAVGCSTRILHWFGNNRLLRLFAFSCSGGRSLRSTLGTRSLAPFNSGNTVARSVQLWEHGRWLRSTLGTRSLAPFNSGNMVARSVQLWEHGRSLRSTLGTCFMLL